MFHIKKILTQEKAISMKAVLELIKSSQSFILSTHKHCDGDGLGAELAVYYALSKIGKKVRIINVDPTPHKYRFLNPDQHIQYFDTSYDPIEETDLALIFDTNDERLVYPLFETLVPKCKNIAFVDHHPMLQKGTSRKAITWIHTAAASTGELAFYIIKACGIPLDARIAQALYTSITFDTQLYRFIRSSPASHQIAAELLSYDFNSEEVHQHLFANQTVNKVKFLSLAWSQLEYFANDQIAFLKIYAKDLKEHTMHPDEVRDIIDMIMNIESLQAAALIREDDPGVYKISLRSKGTLPVLPIAESLGGGGHLYAAGATLSADYKILKKNIIDGLINALKK